MRIYAAPAVAEAEAEAGHKRLCDGRSNSAIVLPLDASSANRRDISRWSEGRVGVVWKAAGFKITIAPPWAARPVSPLHISFSFSGWLAESKRNIFVSPCFSGVFKGFLNVFCLVLGCFLSQVFSQVCRTEC